MKITAPPITPGDWCHSGNNIRKATPKGPGHAIVHLYADGPQPEWSPNLKAIAALPAVLKALESAYERAASDANEHFPRDDYRPEHAAEERDEYAAALTLAGYKIEP